MDFTRRVQQLPRLGLGVSTEFGASAAQGALDIMALRQAHPSWAAFLEVGVEDSKGMDHTANAWVTQGWPTTYHFLDVNLDDEDDLDDGWLSSVRARCAAMAPAWLCGDAGLWHFGARDAQHMLLLPPILTDDSARHMARGVRRLREATNLEVLPENPPGTAYIGDLHLLDYYAQVCSHADSGMLLDIAHLVMFQRSRGLPATHGLDAFPLERIVEVHVAGGTLRKVDGLEVIDDSHTTTLLDDTWQVMRHLQGRLTNLKAVVFECERNDMATVTRAFPAIADVRWWP
jgi:uncharacterized protein